jgi:ABC-2 type transport system ATP-binding protein
MVVYDYLKFISEIRGLSQEKFLEQLKQVSKKCGIEKHLHLSIGTLSKGYKQRVGLAQAILHDPPILILDEPTNGLDPNQIIEIRQLIKDLGKEKTLIISSHILQEVQAICDRIIIINEGLIVADANKNQLLKGIEKCQNIEIEFTKGQFDLNRFKGHFSGIKVISYRSIDEQIQMLLESYQKEDIRVELSQYLSDHHCHILELKQKHYSLEDIFHQLTQIDTKTGMEAE